MKTTVEISDPLLDEAKKMAGEGTTLRILIERGLLHVLSAGRLRRAFRLRKASFKGRGLSTGAARLDWRQLGQLPYDGRGG